MKKGTERICDYELYYWLMTDEDFMVEYYKALNSKQDKLFTSLE